MSQSLFVAKPNITRRLSGTTFGTLDVFVAENFIITTTGAATATLPNGAYDGQIVSIVLSVDGGDLVVAADFQVALVSATFADAGDSLTLRWASGHGGWTTLANVGGVVFA